MRRGTGARGLRAVMEELLLECMFDLPSLGGGVYRLDAEAVQAGSPRRVADRSAA